MHWLNPFGWLALLLALPIILLYFLRLHRQEARVPSLLLWEAVLADRRANRPWQKLRRNWLLFLQLLALLALTISLARPAQAVPVALRGQVIVLLDVSASMQARHDTSGTRFAVAQTELRRLADTLDESDRVTLIAVGPTLDVVLPEGDVAAFRRALESLAPTDGPADWDSAAVLASGLASGRDVTTLLVTDAALSEPLPALPGAVRLIAVGDAQPNTGIVALALRRSGNGLDAFVRLHHSGPAAERTLSLYADGVLVDRRALSLSADGEASLVVPGLPALAWVEARLDGEDGLALDDRAWVALPAAGGGNVLLLTPGNRFLEQALRGLPALDVTQSPDLAAVAGSEGAYGLVVADGPFTGTLPLVSQWLIAPGSDTLCGEPGDVFTPTTTVRGQWSHPLLRYVEWSEVHVARARHYTPPDDADILIEAADGPLFWVLERPGQRVACLAFDLHASDLPLRLAFPVLTANLTGWLLPEASTEPATPLPAGFPWTPPLPPDAAAATLTTPTGARFDLLSGALPPTVAGLYRLDFSTSGGALSRYVALALLSDAESDLTPRPVTVGGAALPATLEETPGWRELTRWAALAALLLVLLEAGFWWRPRLWPLRRPQSLKVTGEIVLRVILLVALLLVFLDARWNRRTRDLAVVFLLDRSASTQAVWENELAFVRAALAEKSAADRAGIVVFGANAWVDRTLSPGPELAPVATFPRAEATDIEEAVQLGLALIPAGAPGRLVLISDGLETVGRAQQALGQLSVRGVDLVVVGTGPGLPGGEVWLADLRLPTRVYPGDTVPVAVTVGADRAQTATLSWATGDVAGQREVALRPGEEAYAFSVVAAEPGFMPLRVCLSAAEDAFVQNNCADGWVRVEGTPQVLVVGAPDERAALVAALQRAGLEVDALNAAVMPFTVEALTPYAAVVLVNTPARDLPSGALAALQSFVRDVGGGLVAIGGPDSYGVGGWLRTPLEETLPVEMLVQDPRRFPPMAMVIVIDKSGSMSAVEGGRQKIQLAAEAAARVAEALNDADALAVVAYDDRPATTLGPFTMDQRDVLIADLMRLQSGGGGIYVSDSLRYAEGLFDQIELLPQAQRHILLLADGADAERQEGVLDHVAELRRQGFTVSVVAIGEGSDVPFLTEVAATGEGRFYLAQQAADLPEIFGEEVLRAKRSYVVEELFYPQAVSSWEPVAGLAATPPLRGYIAATPKSSAQVVWEATQGDPLLAVWQYGLGRAVAWTSDATGRWAAGWVSWEEFSRFWGSVVRWTLAQPSDEGLAVRVETDGERARVIVDALTFDGSYADGLALALHVATPGAAESVQELPLRQVASGRYEGEFALTGQRGVLLSLTGDRRFTTGWTPPPPVEYLPGDADAAVARLVAQGGGRLETAPEAAFAHTLRGRQTGAPLAPWLLLFAALLWPVDIAWRRLALTYRDVARFAARVAGRWPRRRARGPAPTAPTLAASLRRRVPRPQPRAGEPVAGPPATSPSPPLAPLVPPAESTPSGLRAAQAPSEAADEDTLASRLRRRLKE